jgi:hypothetical protein
VSDGYLNPPRGGWKGGKSPHKHAARGRKLHGHKRGEMNGTERKYAETVLEPRKLAGEIVDYQFESVTLKLGKDTRWTADFFVMYPDGLLEFVDVKGGQRDEQAERVKIRLASEKFYMFRFIVARAKLVRDGGGFNVEEI